MSHIHSVNICVTVYMSKTEVDISLLLVAYIRRITKLDFYNLYLDAVVYLLSICKHNILTITPEIYTHVLTQKSPGNTCNWSPFTNIICYCIHQRFQMIISVICWIYLSALNIHLSCMPHVSISGYYQPVSQPNHRVDA